MSVGILMRPRRCWPAYAAAFAAGAVVVRGDEEDADATCSLQGCPADEASPSSSSSSSCGCGALKRSDFASRSSSASSASSSSSSARKAMPSKDGESEDEASVIFLEGGPFMMGVAPIDEGEPTIHPLDNEFPRREENVKPFGLGKFEVSNRRFAKFVQETKYVTEAESFGWSFGVVGFIDPEVEKTIDKQVQAAPWWLPVNGADWRHPNGPGSNITDRMDHPVSQVSLRDAEAFCAWSRQGGRLPSEAEWEFAARGNRKSYSRHPWGNSLLTGRQKERHRMNAWQSELDPQLQRDGKWKNFYLVPNDGVELVRQFYTYNNTALDGYKETAPVDAYGPQNGFGFHNIVGNVWEWTSSEWVSKENAPPVEPGTMVKKGGSFLCHMSTCNRFRSSARMMFTADSAAPNVGFRCAYPPRDAGQDDSGDAADGSRTETAASDESSVKVV
eukprot:TRINITY_DN45068_c0_g1_i2.p1 TRINITY_DN45068_c0_g1~~TRINITY_DN45068_c0_g1_i2.p1  ORF type:complete len:445 (-),score=84.82 TRINITY_DN45068_c0_g1_i2:14-1348(-)